MRQRLQMVRSIALWLALAACIGIGFSSALTAERAPTVHAGTLDGAPYRIDIPADWNGDLVMLMHGYEPVFYHRKVPMTPADATPVRPLQ